VGSWQGFASNPWRFSLPINRGGDGSSPRAEWGRAVPTPGSWVPCASKCRGVLSISRQAGRVALRAPLWMQGNIEEQRARSDAPYPGAITALASDVMR
jgi:hypothetical protein